MATSKFDRGIFVNDPKRQQMVPWEPNRLGVSTLNGKRIPVSATDPNFASYVRAIIGGERRRAGLSPVATSATPVSTPPAGVAPVAGNPMFSLADRIFPQTPTADPYAGMSPAMAMAARSRASGFRGTGPMKKEQKAFGALGSSVFDNARRESWLAKTVPEYENTRLAQEGATARTSAMQAGQTEREIMKQEQKKAELKQKDFQFREEYRFKREELDSEGQQELDLVAANLGKETALKKMEIDAESARDNRLGQDKLTFEIAKYGMEAQLADRKGNESLREGLLTLQQEAINKANEYKKPEDRIENLNVPAANAPFTPSPAVAAPQAAVPTNQPATARPKLEGDTNNDGVVDLQEAHAMLAGISTLIQDGLRDGTFTPNDPRYNHVLAKRKQYEDMITGEFKRKDLERKSRERKV